MAEPLKHCTITPADDGGFRLQLEAADGTAFEAVATFEQLDLLAEEIDRLLDEADEDEVAAPEDETD